MRHKTNAVLNEVLEKRMRQNKTWGDQDHPNGTGWSSDAIGATFARKDSELAAREGRLFWRHILDEEIAEAYAEDDPVRLRAELVQVAAVAVAWVEAIDRRQP